MSQKLTDLFAARELRAATDFAGPGNNGGAAKVGKKNGNGKMGKAAAGDGEPDPMGLAQHHVLLTTMGYKPVSDDGKMATYRKHFTGSQVQLNKKTGAWKHTFAQAGVGPDDLKEALLKEHVANIQQQQAKQNEHLAQLGIGGKPGAGNRPGGGGFGRPAARQQNSPLGGM